MMPDEFVLLEANPYHLGIVQALEDKHILVRWLPGEAWMRPWEIVSERAYRQRHPAYLEPRDRPLYDVFEDRPIAGILPALLPGAVIVEQQSLIPDETRRVELQSMTAKELKEQFRHRGDRWRKFANSASKSELIKQLLEWPEGESHS